MIFSGWWFQPTHLKNDGVRQLGWMEIPNWRKTHIQNVPNHQPETVVQTLDLTTQISDLTIFQGCIQQEKGDLSIMNKRTLGSNHWHIGIETEKTEIEPTKNGDWTNWHHIFFGI